MIKKPVLDLLRKQHYGVVGRHSAVKICTWTKKSIEDKGYCYKQKFYGIRSHLCCQMTPSIICTNKCVFCWRDQTMPTARRFFSDYDDPEYIIEESIKQQRKLISGLKGYKGTDMKKFNEAQEPMHFAISLTGEPTLYPKIGELIDLLHKKGKTTFLVTNGQLPDALKKLRDNNQLPTQLYISLDAPRKEIYERIDKPIYDDYWKRFNESLEIMASVKKKTRTILRITAIKGLNMCCPDKYVKLINKADPWFVEVKAYMFVGGSRQRLSIENMPRHNDVVDFAKQICKLNGMKIIDEKKDSRVVLIGKKDRKDRIMKFK